MNKKETIKHLKEKTIDVSALARSMKCNRSTLSIWIKDEKSVSNRCSKLYTQELKKIKLQDVKKNVLVRGRKVYAG